MQPATLTMADRLRAAAVTHGEEFLAEFPTTVRRLGLLFVALAISVPLFLVSCAAILAWALVG